MKKLLLSLAAVASVGTALPAAAQTWHHRPAFEHNVQGPNARINHREANLQSRIDIARAQHRITRTEAERLRAELWRIEAVEHQYRRRGLSRAEFNNLNARMDRVQFQLDQRLYASNYFGRW